MKRRYDFSLKKLLFAASLVLSTLLALLPGGVAQAFGSRLLHQTAAERWSAEKDVAQVSCFFSVDSEVTPELLKSFSHGLDSALVEASIYSESLNEDARLWADAYSAKGKITVSAENGAEVSSDAFGIGGDFFLFHPLQLLSGSYFSGNDLNQDYVILNRNAAWKLFGSNDVAGMTVYIKNVPHVIAGVVETESGAFAKKAGAADTMIFVSYTTLNAYGSNHGINHYEIVMPNPISEYAYSYVKENIGVEEAECVIVENSSRYDLWNRLKLIKDFAVRSMNGKAIIYPYWENVARGYEDIASLLTFLMLLFTVYPAVALFVMLYKRWKRKKWTARSIYVSVKDRIERRIEKRRLQKKKEEEIEYEELI